jgi:tetratricopeptide (TPR) repeat protein
MRRRVFFVVTLGALLFSSGPWDDQMLAGPAARLRARWGQRRSARGHCCCCSISAVDETSESVASAVALGDQLREKEDWDGAIAAYAKAIALDPQRTGAFCGRGRALANKGNLDAALADFNEAIRLDPESDQAYSARGGIFAAKGQFDKGFSDLETAIRLNPASAYAFSMRGMVWKMKGDYDRAISDLSEAIRLDPTNCDVYLRRSWLLASKHEFQKAVADLDAVVRLKPTSASAYFHEVRGFCLVESGNYDGAIADFQEMLRLNPADPAAQYEPQRKVDISLANLEHGRRQVEKMLHDRPAMAQLGEKAAPLCEWAARKFAGEDLHERVFWDPTEPRGPTAAEHQTPLPGKPGRIRLRAKYVTGATAGQPRSFEELWQNAVFELHNIAGAETFLRIWDDAIKGRLSRSEYVTKVIECESRAADSTRAFYIRVFLPLARQWRLPTHPTNWYLTYSESGKVPILSLTSKTSDYWQHYEKGYDRLALALLVEKGEWQKAMDAAQEAEKRADTNEEKAAIFGALGRAYADIKRYDLAITAFGKVIECDPKCAIAYESRAYAYCMNAQYAKSVADYSEAIRLNPNRATLYDSRASAFFHNGQYDKAVADCSEAIRRDPKNASLYMHRGAAYARMAKWDNAIADAKSAIELDPNSDEARRLREWIDQQTAKRTEQPKTAPETPKVKRDIEFEPLGKTLK